MTAGASTGLPFPLEPVVVVTGHYGAGKTNFALNLALDAAAAGYRATLADMDVVNPYFRSNEYRDLLEGAGVRLIAPVFGHTGTSLDVPSVTGELAVAAAEAYRDETGAQSSSWMSAATMWAPRRSRAARRPSRRGPMPCSTW